VIGVVTLPFSVERFRYDNAKNALKVLRQYCDTVVAIDNTKLSKVAGDLPLQQALGVANELVGQFVKGITETITTASLINIDYADLRAICERKGLAAIGRKVEGLRQGRGRDQAGHRRAAARHQRRDQVARGTRPRNGRIRRDAGGGH
jgi:cell division GTPase FtsZ